MLAYAHINLLSMLSRFDPEEAILVATDGIYVQKTALSKLTDISAYVALRPCDCNDECCPNCLMGKTYLPPVLLAQWRDKGEQLCVPQEHATVLSLSTGTRK